MTYETHDSPYCSSCTLQKQEIQKINLLKRRHNAVAIEPERVSPYELHIP